MSTSRFAASDDGRYIVFVSASNNLSADDPGDRADVFVKDALTGELTRITRRADGGEPNGSSHEATISGDGRWIFSISNATDLVSPAPSGLHLYRVDRISSLVQQLTDTGTQTLCASAPSYDGSRVAFTTDAKLAAADTDPVADACLWSQDSGAFTLLSVDSAGQPLPGVVDAVLSHDGRYVVFGSTATNLAGSGTGRQVFRRDRLAATTMRVASTAWSSACAIRRPARRSSLRPVIRANSS